MLNQDFLKVIPTVQAGYALVFEYVRGRFTSGGKWEIGSSQKVDGPDGYDSVEWVAGQPWCDGNVGMAGISYLGMLQWRTARESPPHLKAIAPAQSGAPGEVQPEVWDAVFTLNMATGWGVMMAADILDKLEKQGQDVSGMREMVNRAATNPAEVYNYLPLKDVPQFNIKGLRELWEDRLYMYVPTAESDLSEPYPFEKVIVPALNISSWYDMYTRRTFHSFLSMRKRAGSAFTREHQHIFVGPWSHGKATRVLGDIDFGGAADALGSRVAEYQLSFFDKYLKGLDVALPALRYFTMGKMPGVMLKKAFTLDAVAEVLSS
jgi:putative CocE/NonD family hydrolase